MQDQTRLASTAGGLGFPGALAILFIALKLLGYIDWSWWWVLSPLWIGLVLAFGFFLVFLVAVFVGAMREVNRR